MGSKLGSVGVLQRRGDRGSDGGDSGRRKGREVREGFAHDSLLYDELLLVRQGLILEWRFRISYMSLRRGSKRT